MKRLLAPATAQDYDKGMAAYKRGDYAVALREWRPLAEEGKAPAQLALGRLYLNGLGVSQDKVLGAKLIRQAAEKGHSFAQAYLALLFQRGEGVQQDFAEMGKWLWLAAEQGETRAMYSVAHNFNFGFDVPQDYALAHTWYNLAASFGDQDAREDREYLAKKMTREQIAEAQRMAREWLEVHPQ